MGVGKPAFLGIGAQKCASTWIYQVLSDHPDINVSSPKELDFFSCFFDRGTQWYESKFPPCSGKQLLGEISPSYFPDYDAPARAKAYNPNFRVILALRDPIERAYSNHLHDVRLGHITGDLTFEAGLKNNPMYIEQSKYATHLRRWMECFPREQILVVFQEDVKKDPELEARRLYRFLGVDESHQSEFADQKANESYLPKSRRKEVLYRQIGRLLGSIGLGALAGLIRKSLLFQKLKASNRQNIRALVPPMKQDTRSALEKDFDVEVRELMTLLERDSIPWGGGKLTSRSPLL